MVPPAPAVSPLSLHAALPILPTGTVRVEPPAAVLGVGLASSDRVVATLGWFRSAGDTSQLLAGVALGARPEHATCQYQVPAVAKEWAAESGARGLVTVAGLGA